MSLQYHSCTANKTGSCVSLTQKGYQTKVRITFTNYYFGSSNLSLFDKEDTVEQLLFSEQMLTSRTSQKRCVILLTLSELSTKRVYGWLRMKLSRLGKQMEHLLVFRGGRHSSLELVYHLLTRSTMEQTVLSSVSELANSIIYL